MRVTATPVWRLILGGLMVVGSSTSAAAVAFAHPAAAGPVTSEELSWGSGSYGELGNGTTTQAQTTPVTVSLPAGVTSTAIAGGGDTGYAIGSDGNLYAWGRAFYGELGNGTTPQTQTTPVTVSLPVTPTAVAAGVDTGYAIGSDGNLYAWGSGGDGQLGNGTTSATQTTPVTVSLPGGVTATAAAAGVDTGYAIGSDGNLYAWGSGGDGELGNATTSSIQTTPVKVSLPAGVTPTAIAAGQDTGYAVGSDGNLYAWGYGGYGELGNSTTISIQTTPVKVSLPTGVTPTAIAAGLDTGYAIGSDANLYAWGSGAVSQLGNGTTTVQQTTPVKVSLPTGVTPTAITAGQDTGYAIGSDGSLFAWGYANLGQIGNGTSTGEQSTPTTVTLPAGVIPTALGPDDQSTTGFVITRSAVTLDQANPVGASITPGMGYSGQLAITNQPLGGGQLTWTTTASSPNITVSSSGAISVPDSVVALGTTTIGGTVADAVGDAGTWSFQLTVQAVVITTTSLPDGTVGTPYSVTLHAVGGNPPYTFWYLVGPSMPRGLHLNSLTGLLSGVPSHAGTHTITFRVRDTKVARGTHPNRATVTLTLTILSG